MAAAHFNRLSATRGLDLHAISRGTDPDASVHSAALAGLAADGLAPAGDPLLLSETDLLNAAKVVAFAELPATFRVPVGTQTWTVPAVSEDYSLSRSAIVSNIESLLADLAQQSSSD